MSLRQRQRYFRCAPADDRNRRLTREEFDSFFAYFLPRVYGYVIRRVGDAGSAESITESVMLRAMSTPLRQGRVSRRAVFDLTEQSLRKHGSRAKLKSRRGSRSIER